MTDMKAVLISKWGMLGVVRNSQKVKRLYWLHCIGLVRNTLDQFLQSSCCFVFKIKSYFANFGSMRICFMTNNHFVPEWYPLSRAFKDRFLNTWVMCFRTTMSYCTAWCAGMIPLIAFKDRFLNTRFRTTMSYCTAWYRRLCLVWTFIWQWATVIDWGAAVVLFIDSFLYQAISFLCSSYPSLGEVC